MTPSPKALRPPPPPPPPPLQGVLHMCPLRVIRLGRVTRTRTRRPWYLLGLVQVVTHPRKGWSWGGNR